MKLEAAYAPPPSRMKRQSVETTFEYVSLGRSFKNTAGLPQGVTCCRTIPPRGGVVKRAEAAPLVWTLTSAPAPHDEGAGSSRDARRSPRMRRTRAREPAGMRT